MKLLLQSLEQGIFNPAQIELIPKIFKADEKTVYDPSEIDYRKIIYEIYPTLQLVLKINKPKALDSYSKKANLK